MNKIFMTLALGLASTTAFADERGQILFKGHINGGGTCPIEIVIPGSGAIGAVELGNYAVKRNDGGDAPVVVTDATPVTSTTGIMTVGSVTPAALSVFTVSYQIDILCYFSVDNKLTWIPFPYVPVTLVG